MLIVVTGKIGVGKSTVCRKVVDLLRDRGYSCGGILTCKDKDKGITVEDVFTGTSTTLASRNRELGGPRAGPYSFNHEGLAFGVDSLNKGTNLPLLVIDEIGPLELEGNGFKNAIALVNSQKTSNCIVVIRDYLLSSFLPLLKSTPLILNTTTANRDSIPSQIVRILTPVLSMPSSQTG